MTDPSGPGTTRAIGGRTSATRWPALVLVPLLLVAMLIAGRDDGAESVGGSTGSTPTSVEGEVVEPGRRPPAMPTASPVDASLSTWYCPVGLSAGVVPGSDTDDAETDEGDADLTDDGLAPPREYVDRILEGTVLLLTNVADEPRSGSVTLMGTDGPITTEAVDLAPRSRFQIDLLEWIEQPAGPVAALVELDGGGVARTVSVDGPNGSTLAPCSSQPSASWYLPVASTTLDARAVLTLFNPFPDDAIVEIALTDRTPPAGFEAFPVPAESVVSVELTDVITVRTQFATTITARTGQVVAALVQEYDGTSPSGQQGLAVVPGAPVPSETWNFPSGVWGESVFESYLLFNPGEVDAQVDVSVALDDPATNGSVQPFEVTVPAGEFAVIGSSSDDWGRVPAGVGHAVIVRVQNGQPIVAAQRQSTVGGERPGVAVALGAPEAATEWIVPAVAVRDAEGALTLQNPSPLTLARADVVTFAGGTSNEPVSIELSEAGRQVLRPDRDSTLEGRPGGQVTSTEPIVVSSSFAFDGAGRAWFVAIPVSGTTVTPNPVETD